MFTTVAFSESQDPGGAYVKMAGVPDPHIFVSGDDIRVPEFNNVCGVYGALGASCVGARLVAPSLRRVSPFYINPIDLELTPTGDRPLVGCPNIVTQLETDEALNFELNSNPAAAEQASAVVFLSQGPLTPVQGNIQTVLAQASVTLAAGVWAYQRLTFSDDLPVGLWDIVGARCVSTTSVAFRLVIPGVWYRPGGIICDTDGVGVGYDPFRFGRMGKWATFHTNQGVGVEVLCSAATGAQTVDVYLDILKSS